MRLERQFLLAVQMRMQVVEPQLQPRMNQVIDPRRRLRQRIERERHQNPAKEEYSHFSLFSI
jgi:hypothetical protein